MKVFKVSLMENKTTSIRISYISSDNFEDAVSKVYIRKHSLRSETGNDWRIVTVEEVGSHV